MIFTNPEGNQGYINLERALETQVICFYKVGSKQASITSLVGEDLDSAERQELK